MKQEPLIVSIILNYQKYSETLTCVESIRRQSYQNKKIIIVENGSGNESWEILNKHYADSDDVILIQSERNLGFAKGNNLGIRYANKTLHCDYAFVVNSDVEVLPGLFEAVVKHDSRGVGVISPKVYKTDGHLQPLSVNTDNMETYIKTTVKNLYLASFLHAPLVSNVYTMYKARNKKNGHEPKKDTTRTTGKYVLYGCSYFLTREFFKHYDGLYPNTFLYWEEINLLVMLQKAGLSSVLIDDGALIHKEKASTKELVKTNFQRKTLKFSRDSYRASKPMFKMNYKTIKRKYDI